jgi:hypothetical protein
VAYCTPLSETLEGPEASQETAQRFSVWAVTTSSLQKRHPGAPRGRWEERTFLVDILPDRRPAVRTTQRHAHPVLPKVPPPRERDAHHPEE